MDKRVLALKLLEADAHIQNFEAQMLNIGVDVDSSELQFIFIPSLVGELLGVPPEDIDAIVEMSVFLDDTVESHNRFIDDICAYVEKYVAT